MCELWLSAANGHPGPMFGSYPVVIPIPEKTENKLLPTFRYFRRTIRLPSEYDVIWEVQSNHE